MFQLQSWEINLSKLRLAAWSFLAMLIFGTCKLRLGIYFLDQSKGSWILTSGKMRFLQLSMLHSDFKGIKVFTWNSIQAPNGTRYESRSPEGKIFNQKVLTDCSCYHMLMSWPMRWSSGACSGRKLEQRFLLTSTTLHGLFKFLHRVHRSAEEARGICLTHASPTKLTDTPKQPAAPQFPHLASSSAEGFKFISPNIYECLISGVWKDRSQNSYVLWLRKYLKSSLSVDCLTELKIFIFLITLVVFL